MIGASLNGQRTMINDKWYQTMKFRTRLSLLLSIFFIALIGFQSGLFFYIFEKTVAEQVGSKALIQAKELASDPQVISSLNNKDRHQIDVIFRRINRLSDSDYVVIANNEEIRLFHPNPDYIGKKINSQDNYNALNNGQSYVSVRKGESGLSVRGKAPVITGNGQIIGVVSVGYLVDKLSDRIFKYSLPILGVVAIAIFMAIIGAYIFSNHIKSQMFNMEPRDIAQTLQIKKSVMQSMYEGVIATNRDGTILSINKSALNMLNITQLPEQLLGRSIQEYITPAIFFLPCKETEVAPDVNDEIITCNGESFIATRVKMISENAIIGSVVSLRKRDDITTLTTQLAQVQHYIDNLRVIRHEHNNQLSTISGLLQIGEYDQALLILESTNSKQQALIDFVTQIFKPKIIAGLLLGKISRAEELGLRLDIDTMSGLDGGCWPIREDELSAVLGNLLDNAFESTIRNPNSNKTVSLFLTDQGEELIIEVNDNGIGFQNNDPLILLKRGVTSKNEGGHGIGLYLVHQYVKKAKGTMMMEEAEPQGAIFSIYIPKIQKKDPQDSRKGKLHENV